MGTVQDKDIAIWVCRHGTSADVVEFPAGGKEPIDQACASHGEPFIKRCPRVSCPRPTYHWSDLDRNYHHCSEKIPWAAQREETARALMEYDNHHSRLVGRTTPDEPAPSLFEALIGPHKEEAQMPKEPPRISGVRTTGSDLQGVQREVEAYRARERRATKGGVTWNQLEALDIDKVGAFRDTPTATTKRWWHRLSAPAKALLWLLGTALAGVLTLLTWTWLVAQGYVRP